MVGVAVVVGGFHLLGTSALAAHHRAACPTAGRSVVAVSKQATVYEAQVTRSGGVNYVGCARRSRKRTALNRLELGVSSARPRLAGRYVALSIVIDSRTAYATRSAIRGFDLVTGKPIMRDENQYANGVDGVPDDVIDGPPSLIVAADGGVAWTSPHGPGDPLVDVRYVPRGQTVRLLDQTADVDPDSLALGRSYVYWRRGGVAVSAAR